MEDMLTGKCKEDFLDWLADSMYLLEEDMADNVWTGLFIEFFSIFEYENKIFFNSYFDHFYLNMKNNNHFEICNKAIELCNIHYNDNEPQSLTN